MTANQIKIEMHEIEDPKLLSEFDSKRIVGLISPDQKTLNIAYLSELIPLSEKVSVKIPLVSCKKDARPSIISSVQVKRGSKGDDFALNEIIGPINPMIFSWVGAIVANMRKMGLANAFFPAYNIKGEEPGFFCGNINLNGGMASVRTITDRAVKNIRLTQSSTVFFAAGKEIRKISFNDTARKDWLAHSSPVASYGADIGFLGRPNKGSMTVTLVDGKTYNIGLGESRAGIDSNKAILLERVSSLLPIGSGVLVAVSKERENMFFFPEAVVTA